MKIVVLNAGSGSQRCSLFETSGSRPRTEPLEPLWEARLDTTAPNQPPGRLFVDVRRGGRTRMEGTVAADDSLTQRTGALLRRLWEGDGAPLAGSSKIDVVGHRVVHGGEDFHRAVLIDAAVEAAIDRLGRLAPLHNPANLEGIRAARACLGPAISHVAVFDTAFHHTLPAAAATYAGPWQWRERGIRRYGFHGTNFRWVSERAARLLGRIDDPEVCLVLCHLGGGCSLCATRGGRSVDTTMGFTPLDGIAMSTRSGAIDPGILIHLLREGETVDGLERILNRESGLKGLSGISGDTRILRSSLEQGDPRARLAWDVFVHRLQAGISQMLAALGRPPDAFVFTDAMAEDEPMVRTAACAPFAFLGLQIDERINCQSPPDADLSTPDSRVRALLVKSREAWQIARECLELVGRSSDG